MASAADATHDVTDTTTASTGDAAPTTGGDGVTRLAGVRATVLPILRAITAEYATRTRPGYPRVVDNVPQGGVFGLNLDTGYGVYFMTDGNEVWAELHTVHLRTDALSAANVEKFAGRPNIDRFDIAPTWTDLDYRNVVARLLSAWNYQQLMIFKVDS